MTKNYKSHYFKKAFSKLSLFLLAAGGITSFNLHAQTTYSFTSCGVTGQFGPNQAQVNTAYAVTNLSAAVTSTLGIQEWTVPAGVSVIQIQAFGAQGASSGAGAGGLGARIYGDFTVTPGQVLRVLVGQRGVGAGSGAAGGGGGSYVSTSGNVPLVVAGGGSGSADVGFPGLSAGTASVGNPGQNCASTGTTGFGGGDANICGCGAGGAGGFFGNGSSGGCYGSQFGYGFVNGGNGGISSSGGRVGGFGGGAGTHANNTGGGAGGGYTGGGAPNHGSQWAGGAGASYNAGINQVNTGSVQAGDGKVNIISLCMAGVTPTLTGNQSICSNNSSTLQASGSGTINWYPTPSSTLVLGTGTAFVTPTLAVGNYTYYAASTNTCAEGSRAPITVTVNSSPTVAITGGTTTVCPGTAIILTANGANTYSWNTGAVTSSIAPTPSANATYTVIGTSTVTGCSVSVTKSVIVFAPANITTAGSGSICVGQNISIASNGGVTYTWQPGNLSGFQITVSPTVTTVYTVTGTDGNGCSNTATASAVVDPCTGVNELSAFGSQLRIYPNPNSGEFTISSDSDVNLSVINNLGQVVKTISLNGNNNHKASVVNLANGIYFIEGTNSANQKVKQKIVVSK